MTTGTIQPDKLRGPHRLFYISRVFEQLLEKVKPTMVVFEDYVQGFRKSTGRLAHLGEVGGVLKTAAWAYGAEVLIVPNATLKSVIAGSGKADKGYVARSLQRLYGYSTNQDDEADALGLMLIGEHRCGSTELKTTKSRLESVAKCEMVPSRYRGFPQV